MNNSTNFFIHIQSDTLAHYFVHGLFCPVQFLTNKSYDIQNNYESYLLLSDKKWNVDSDCSVEIELLEEEISKLLKIQNNYFLIQTCFPLSRLRKIHFEDKKKAEMVIWNINNGAAFVPNWVVSFESKLKNDIASLKEEANIPTENQDQDLKTKIKKYNRLMGGLTFMRIGLLAKNNLNLDVTKDYLSVLSYFNTHILNEIKSDIKINNDLQNIFTGEKEIFKYLAKDISLADVSLAGKNESQNVQRKFNTITFDNLDPNSLTFKLAMLNTYGKGKVKSDNDLVSGLLSKTKDKLVEELSLIFGLYIGYSDLRNRYSNELGTLDIKFKLNSILDFYLIESLFNYTFHDKAKSEKLDITIPKFNKHQQVIKNDLFNYINILGESFAYEKSDITKLNKDSLTSLLLKTISGWCKKHKANYDEKSVSRKINSAIIPEIVGETSSKKIEKNSFKTNIKKEGLKTNQEKKSKFEGSNEEVKSKDVINSPSLFPEIDSKGSDGNLDEVSNLSMSELNNKTMVELKSYCKEKRYKGYSKLNKEDLVKFILSQ